MWAGSRSFMDHYAAGHGCLIACLDQGTRALKKNRREKRTRPWKWRRNWEGGRVAETGCVCCLFPSLNSITSHWLIIQAGGPSQSLGLRRNGILGWVASRRRRWTHVASGVAHWRWEGEEGGSCKNDLVLSAGSWGWKPIVGLVQALARKESRCCN